MRSFSGLSHLQASRKKPHLCQIQLQASAVTINVTALHMGHFGPREHKSLPCNFTVIFALTTPGLVHTENKLRSPSIFLSEVTESDGVE